MKNNENKKEKNNATKKVDIKAMFNKQVFLAITVCVMAVLAILYVYVFLGYQEKTEKLEAANREQKKYVDELEVYYNNLPEYEQGITDMKQQLDNILNEYPVDVREEDIIMLAVALQTNNKIDYNSVTMEDRQSVYDIAAETAISTNLEDYNSSISFGKKRSVYNNVTTYNDLKGIIEAIFASNNRIGLEDVNYVKNEEDATLEGSIVLNFYSAARAGKEYVAPDIAKYLAGTDDLFKLGEASESDE